MSELRAKTTLALVWSYFGKIGAQGLSLIAGILLARLLLPEHFGLMSICMIFCGLGNLLTDFGLTSALIQRQQYSKRMLDSVFWVNMVMSVSLYLAFFLASPYLASYFGHNELNVLLPLALLTIILGGAGSVPQAMLSKSLDFKSITIASVSSIVISAAIAIYMALDGFGVYALIAQQLISQLVRTLVLFWLVKWLPKLRFAIEDIRAVFSFSVYVFLTQMLQYLSNNLDSFLIGKYLTATQLGYYSRGKNFTLAPMRNVIASLNAVMFPSLSSIHTQKDRVFNIYLQSIELLAFAIFPIMGGLYWVVEDLVHIVLGERWLPIAPLVQVFCIAGALIGLVSINGAIFMSQGKSKVQFKLNLFTKPITILCSVGGLQFGLMGIVYGFLISKFINTILSQFVLCKVLNKSLMSVWAVLVKPAICVAIMTLVLAAVSSFVTELPILARIALLVIAGIVSYIFASIIAAKALLFELIGRLKEVRGKNHG